ncbi:hypothetical protein BKA62DRAFT_775251 [Auriculariales sp. MPI-PUGE-AT-0066]|nr:hypothetical protein BKA62DRAFT_775251 [Auriculariales sp. MPI-PUGE-AT-0066]
MPFPSALSNGMDTALTAGIVATKVLSPVSGLVPVVGDGLGKALDALGKLLQAIQDAEHNKKDLNEFGAFIKDELEKIKNTVEAAPVDRRAEIDARFAGVTSFLNRAITEVELLASQHVMKRVFGTQKAKDTLAELKNQFRDKATWLTMWVANQVLENQLREHDRQRHEREQALLELKLKSVIAGTALGKDAPSGCMPDTREELLEIITLWATDPAAACVLWLSGLAGTGKSTVSRSVADRLAKAGKVVISFFISRRHGEQRTSILTVIHTLAIQLARAHETARILILEALESHPQIHDLNLDQQVNLLLLEPLRAMSAGSSGVATVLILDALDECDDPEALVGDGCLAKLIPALGDRASLGDVKLFLTSRSLTAIGAKLRPFLKRLDQEVKLHEIPTTDDIRTYLDRSLCDIRQLRELSTEWPSATDLDLLVHRAGSLFIYAATVVRYIRKDIYTPQKRLAEALSIQTSSSENESPYKEMDKLYLEVLSLSFDSEQPQPLTHQVRQIIAVVALAREPMSTRMISDLLDIEYDTVRLIISGLSAIWVTPSSESDPIVVYHKSFPDFIIDISRCTDRRFAVDCSVGHEHFATGCLHILNTLLLDRDMCKIPFPAGQELPHRDSINDIDARIAHYVSPALRYSAVHLLHHVVQIAVADVSEALVNNLRVFCQEKLMFWLELTCLMGPTTLSNLIVELMGIPAETLDHDRISECGVLLRQLGQAAQYFEEPLRASHAEVYNSLLAFMPKNALKSAYSHIRGFIKVVRADDWDYPANRALIRADSCDAENLVTTADGSVVACGWISDSEGQSVLVWQNATRSSMHYTIPVQHKTLVLLALHPSGRTLVVSTYSDSADLSQISVWQLSGAQPVLMRTRSVDGRTLALALDPTGRHVVLVSPHSVITLMIMDLADVISCCHEFPYTVQRAGFSSAGTALMAVSGTPRKDNDDESSSTGTTIMTSTYPLCLVRWIYWGV